MKLAGKERKGTETCPKRGGSRFRQMEKDLFSQRAIV
jgi:hypothetical protein